MGDLEVLQAPELPQNPSHPGWGGWSLGEKGRDLEPQNSRAAHLTQPRQAPARGADPAGAAGQREYSSPSYLSTPAHLALSLLCRLGVRPGENTRVPVKPSHLKRGSPSDPDPSPALFFLPWKQPVDNMVGRPQHLLRDPQLTQALPLLLSSAQKVIKILLSLVGLGQDTLQTLGLYAYESLGRGAGGWGEGQAAWSLLCTLLGPCWGGGGTAAPGLVHPTSQL